MPHTFAHPFFAAPLKRLMPRFLRASGLALGSMAPDFEYFAAMEPYRTIGHTFAGFFLIHLPLCAAAALVIERLLLPTLPLLLPSAGGWDRFAAERLRMRPLAKPGDWLAFIVSLFIGFLTHLFMDGWTHGHTWFTNRYWWLHRRGLGDFVVYETLQFVFSALGAGAIALYVLIRWRAWRKANGGAGPPVFPASDKRRFRRSVAWVWIAAITAKGLIDPPFSLYGMANVAPFAALVCGWVIAALARRNRRAARAAFLTLLAVMIGHSCAETLLLHLYRGVVADGLFRQWLTAIWVAALWGYSLIAACCAAAARPRPPRNPIHHNVRSV
jgi:hypothetical protein